MAGQEQKRSGEFDVPDDDAQAPTQPTASAQDFAVDDLLDEIDGVLEVNAESFVKGFVQKGGQ